MPRVKTVQLRLKRAVFLTLPVTLLLSLVQVIYSAPASATAPRAASLIGRTGGDLITVSGNAACQTRPRGVTNDGTFIYFRTTLTATSQTICKTTLSGVYVSHNVITDSSISGDQRDMAHSNGCLLIPDSTAAPSTGLKCILASNLSTVVALTIPSGYPMLQKTSGWMIRNIADLPDGRIGFMGEPASAVGNGYPNANGVACPAGKFCKVFRTYSVTGTAPNLSLSFSRDYVLEDASASWPNDEHGIASNGTYLYEIRHLGGYRVWTLSDSGTSPMAFNGHTSSTVDLTSNTACQASAGLDSDCSIRYPEAGVSLNNVTFMTHNHLTNRYILGDFDAVLTPTLGPIFYMTPGVQEITFNTVSTKTFGESAFLLSASDTSTSGTAPTYTSQTLATCSVSTRTVTIVGAGSCTITATVVESRSYNGTTAQQTFTVNKAAQSGFLLSSTSGTYLTNLRLLSSGGNDTGTVSFAVSSAGTAGCSITNSDSLTSTSAGTCLVVATKLATNNFFSAFDTQTVTIGKASLALTLSVTGSSIVKYGSSAATSFTTNRSLGTGNIADISGTVSHSTVSSTACSINSSTGAVLMTAAAGVCSVRVSLANDPNYSDANSSAVSLTAAKADTLTVTASAVNLTYTGAAQAVPYNFAISGLKFSDTLTALSYNYSGSPNSGGGASGSANVDQAGVYTITPSAATISNSDSYTAISFATGTLTVNRATRAITGSSVASVKYGSQESVTVTTSPASSSDGAVTFAAGASTACTVGSGTGIVSMNRAAGTCLIVPTIAQGANYLAATAASAVSITPAKADTITVTSGNAGATFTGSAVAVSPNFSVSGLIGSDTATVTFRYSGTDNGGGSYDLSSTAPTNAGTYAIAPLVTQVNSDSYTAVANVVNGVLTIDRAARTISPTTYNTNSLKYGASATVSSNTTSPSSSSDGALSYTVGSGCVIDAVSGVVRATTSSGSCLQTVTIGQGNNYVAATASAVSFALSKADTLTVTTANPSALTFTGSPVVVTPSISVSGLVNSDSASNAIFNFSRASTCATGGSCVIGDTGPGGGTVFYVSDTAINAADGVSTGGRYLEAAPSSISKSLFTWCAGGTDPNSTLIGASGTAVGTGALNTKIIIGRCTGGAGFEAAGLTLGGKSDWFLPSQGEQVEMFTQRSLVGFGTGQPGAGYFYFGSTEGANWNASAIVPASGVGAQNKADAISYWPIRAFSPTASAYASSTTRPTNAGSYEITTSGLQLSNGPSTDNYVATLFQSATLTINKAAQSIFSNYGSLEATLGSNFLIYPFGGSGDGAVYLSVSNGTATGCSATNTFVTAVTSGTCVLTVRKSANENFNEASAAFSINFFFFVPAAAAPVSTRSSEIAIDSVPSWSSTASAAPTITSFSPTSGAVGTVVTITGVGLDGVTSGAVARQSLTAVTGISSTSVTAVIGAGSVSGPILLRNSLGVGRSAGSFTVTP